MMVDLQEGVNSQLWHACAGMLIQMPPVNSRVFYFPQGHAEQALCSVDFGDSSRIEPWILCRVDSVKYLADRDTDEVYASIRLVPEEKQYLEGVDEDAAIAVNGGRPDKRPTSSCSKILTQSDANNGGGFSVRMQCGETIFPRLNPPSQNLLATDVHGRSWNFRHILGGTPKRHLLTTGWSTFVNAKKLVAGDSVVFHKSDDGGIYVGIRRGRKNGNGCTPESVVKAAQLAASAQPFEFQYYPHLNTPQFFVSASTIGAAMSIYCYPGMKFRMQFENEESSRVSWCAGTVASVQPYDPVTWPNSPWRALQVTWDKPNQILNANIKCVSPWLVEILSPIPVSALSPPSSQLRKKPRESVLTEIQFKSPWNPKRDNIVSGAIQGARHGSKTGKQIMLFGQAISIDPDPISVTTRTAESALDAVDTESH